MGGKVEFTSEKTTTRLRCDSLPGVVFRPARLRVRSGVWDQGDDLAGEFRGSTPVTLHLTAGTHEVILRYPGHTSWSRELTVVAGDDTRVAATLQPE